MLKTQEKGFLAVLVAVVAATSSVVMLTFWLSNHESPLRRFERALSPAEEGLVDLSDNSSLRIKRKGGIIRLKLPSLHLRKSEMGIPVGEAKEPPLCPPPSVTRSLGICYLRKCSSHHDCSSDRACCFNGCIHTCTDPMDRPAAFDWVEDTSKILPILDVDFDESPKPFTPIRLQNQSTEYAAAVAGEELVHLPGGCLVTATRYMKLKEFMKAPSIEQCRCNDGEVVCDVRANRS